MKSRELTMGEKQTFLKLDKIKNLLKPLCMVRQEIKSKTRLPFSTGQ